MRRRDRMFALRRSLILVFILLVALMPGLAAWPSAPAPATALAATPRVAYVYNTDTVSRDSFKTLLELRGFVVDLVPLAGVGGAGEFDFSVDEAIIIGDDT